jgi:hypothetical protein
MGSGLVGNVVVITLDAEVKDEILQVLLDIVYDRVLIESTEETGYRAGYYNKELLLSGITYLENAIEQEGLELP